MTRLVPLTVRPVYTWRGESIPDEAVQPLLSQGMFLVALAALLGAIRVVLEHQAFKDTSVEADFTGLQQDVAGRSAGRQPVPNILAIPTRAVFTTFMLSGLLGSWIEAVILGMSLCLSMLLRQILPSRFPKWTTIVSQIPLLLRLLIASLVNYFVALKVLEIMWNSAIITFLPMLIGTIFGIFVFSLLLPIPKTLKSSMASEG